MSSHSSRKAENVLLIAAAQANPSALSTVDVRHLDWDYTLAAADQQGIAPLLARWIGQEQYPVPSHVTDRLHAAYWTSHFRNRTLAQQLRRVLAAAAAAEIPVMPLKGAALVAWYYPIPALRPMADLDLLIEPHNVARTAELLQGLGYTAVPRPPSLLHEHGGDAIHREHAFVAGASGMQTLIEYRSEPLDPAVGPLLKAGRESGARYGDHARRMWQRGRPVTLEGAPCMQVTPEDLLLHVATHLTTRHAGFRLLWLRDLREITATHRDILDWDYIIVHACALHLATPVAAALAAAERWLGAPIPGAQIDCLRAASGRGSLWLVAEQHSFATQIAALGQSDLSAGEHSFPWRALAVSVGWFLTGAAPWRGFGRIIAPSRAYMAWWRHDELASAYDYWSAVALRILAIALQIVARAASWPRVRPDASTRAPTGRKSRFFRGLCEAITPMRASTVRGKRPEGGLRDRATMQGARPSSLSLSQRISSSHICRKSHQTGATSTD